MSKGMIEALESLGEIPRLHRGRTPAGMDCAGLILWVYRAVGVDLSPLDRPYSARHAATSKGTEMMLEALASRFTDVTPSSLRCRDRDGDVWVVQYDDGRMHAGVFARGMLYHISDRLHRTAAQKMRPRLHRSFRLLGA